MSEEVMSNVVVEQQKKKPRKKKSLTRKIIEWTLIGIFGAFAAFIIAGNIQGEIKKSENFGQSIRFGVGNFIVLTDSMEPEIPQDSAIITYKQDISDLVSDFNSGKVVDLAFADVYTGLVPESFVPDNELFQEGERTPFTNRIMTHRLREVHVREDVQFGKGRFVFVASGINDKGMLSLKTQYQTFTEVEYLGTVKVSNQFLGKVFTFIVSPFGLIIILLIPAAYLITVSCIDIFKVLKSSENDEASGNGEGNLANISSKDRERLKKELLDEMINKKKDKQDEKQD